MAKRDKPDHKAAGSANDGVDNDSLIPPYDTRDHWDNWRLQSWATRQAKREEEYWVDSMPVKNPDRGWRAMKRDYETDSSLEFRVKKFLQFIESDRLSEKQFDEVMEATIGILDTHWHAQSESVDQQTSYVLFTNAIASKYDEADDKFFTFIEELKTSEVLQESKNPVLNFDGRKIPERMLEEIKDEHAYLRRIIPRRIEQGSILLAEDPSNDPELIEMQWALDTMVKDSGLLKQSPKILIHKPGSHYEFKMTKGIEVQVEIPEYVHITQETAKRFVRKPDERKAVLAHELGHVYNNDLEPEAILDKLINRPTQKREILADRMGALIHGNPRQYAKNCKSFMFYSCRKAQDAKNAYTDTYLSANGRARMLHKWADILEREGATDEKGNLIMEEDASGQMKPLKALAIYERSREFTEAYLEESLKFGISHPVHTPSEPKARR